MIVGCEKNVCDLGSSTYLAGEDGVPSGRRKHLTERNTTEGGSGDPTAAGDGVDMHLTLVNVVLEQRVNRRARQKDGELCITYGGCTNRPGCDFDRKDAINPCGCNDSDCLYGERNWSEAAVKGDRTDAHADGMSANQGPDVTFVVGQTQPQLEGVETPP